MAGITVIGLGKMGAALAWALHDAGHELVVWNRSDARMQPFAEASVKCAADIAEAVTASPVVLVCIHSYPATCAMLQDEALLASLKGRTLVQLSTGTPKESREASAWLTDRGVDYLDGAILAGPKDIGTSDATILLSGSTRAHDRARPFVDVLAPDTRYLGDEPGGAAALDLAWLTQRYGTFIALAHGANLCRSEGVAIEALMALEADRPDIQTYGAVIRDCAYAHSTATLDVWAEALQRIRQQAADAGISDEIPEFVGGLFARAQARGFGPDNVMSLLKVLKEK